jgi:hypothetical protein
MIKSSDRDESNHKSAKSLRQIWYLIVPPASDWTKQHKGFLHSDGVFVSGFPSAPLSRLKRQGEFDSQIECEKARQRLTTRDGPGANQLPTNAKQYFAAHAQCITSDDPRLKGK